MHSFALSALLRADASSIQEPIRVVGDWEESKVVLRELAAYLGRTPTEVGESLKALADDWDTLSADDDGWEDGYPDPTLLTAWQRHRRIYRYTLRAELVYQLLNHLRASASFSPIEEGSVLLVDEYQDLNSCDLQTIALMSDNANAEVFAAGDDDQSIYSFRRAHPAGIRNFTTDYEGSIQMVLEECLRCGTSVVEIANWLISQEVERIPKSLNSITEWPASVHLIRFSDQSDEATQLSILVRREIDRGTPPDEILILLKSDKNQKFSKQIVTKLSELEVNVYQPRANVIVNPDIQQVFEFLVVATHLASDGFGDDLAVRSLLELRSNGIGFQRIWHVVRYCFENGLRFLEAIDAFRSDPERYPGSGLEALIADVDAIVLIAGSLAPLAGEDLRSWFDRTLDLVNVPPEMRQDFDQILEPLADEFANVTAGEVSDQNYVESLIGAMTSLGDTRPAKMDGHVTITTMHGAKGLSSELVVVLQAEDEVIPGDTSAPDEDEARRLLYVSLTRAKQRLVITACKKRTGGQIYVGNVIFTDRTLTRFVDGYGLVAESVDEYLTRAEYFGG
jgi:superfamily I DNA/RNA helicase